MLKKLWQYAKPYRALIATGIFFSAAEAVFELLIPMVMSNIVDVGIKNGDVQFVLRQGAVMIFMAMISLAFGVGAARLAAYAGMHFGAALRKAEYDHIQTFAFSNIENFSTASLVTRLTGDVNAMQQTLMMGMRLFIRAPVMMISALILSIRISLELSAVFLVALPLLIVLVGGVLVKVGPLFRSLQERTDELNLVVQEDLTGIRAVKSFVREKWEEKKFSVRNEALRDNALRAFGTVVLNMPLMMLVVHATTIAVMWFGGHMVYAGTMEAGKLIAYFTYIMQIMMSLMMVSMVFMMFTRSVACGKRICEVLDETPAMSDDGADADAEVKSGAIDFENVSFRYAEENEEWTLRNIDLHIPSGAVVGILGGTGSGKTSLVSLIPRLYEAQEGTVKVDGRAVENYSLAHLRDAVSVVLQKNVLFSGTVRENLRWGDPNATDTELWEACRLSCADELLEKKEGKLDAQVEQGGVNFSGGQKQRLCIARALLKRPKILILDDSTSAVDTATDAKIRKALRENLPETTKLIIAQRVASVMDADVIVVMDGGRIAAQGTHEELMRTCEIYREVYESQREGVENDG